jgi:hypothetical protein
MCTTTHELYHCVETMDQAFAPVRPATNWTKSWIKEARNASPMSSILDEIGKDRHTDDDVEESNDVGIG